MASAKCLDYFNYPSIVIGCLLKEDPEVSAFPLLPLLMSVTSQVSLTRK